MRRARLGTTAYGEVPQQVESEPAGPSIVEAPSQTEDRWTIRRAALSRDLVLDAQAVFTRRLGRTISENEARNMLGSFGDYVWMLVRWKVQPGIDRDSGKAPLAKRGRPAKAGSKRRRVKDRSTK